MLRSTLRLHFGGDSEFDDAVEVDVQATVESEVHFSTPFAALLAMIS